MRRGPGGPRLLDVNGTMQVEADLYDDGLLRTRLELLGQTLEKKESLGVAQMICFEDGVGKMTGESDPRGSGEAQESNGKAHGADSHRRPY